MLVGCATGAGEEPDQDQDQDGYLVGEDCDDTDPERNPGATEICDGVDQDCDGVVDDAAIDAVQSWPDADADGFGDPAAAPTEVCGLGSRSANHDDCDDSDGAVSPAASETCATTYDDDCDGVANEDDAAGCAVSYIDSDGDGMGSDPTPCTCVALGVASSGDCDDTDPDRFPGHDERCDGRDQDCDVDVDEAAIDAVLLWPDADGDSFGDAATLAELRCPEAGWVPNADDCADADPNVSPPAVESCLTRYDDDCDASTDEIGALGCTVWFTDGDADGVGAGVGTCSCLPGGPLVDGDCDDADPTRSPAIQEQCGDAVDQDCDGVDATCGVAGDFLVEDVATVTYSGTAIGGYAGKAALGIGGDYDGDGAADAIVTEDAVVYVLPGPLVGSLTSVDAVASFAGDYWQSSDFGDTIVFVDADGDGIDDVAIGDPEATDPWFSAGAVYILRGPTAGPRLASAPDATLSPREAYDELGLALAVLDANGDGLDDLLVGAPGLGDDGGAALFLGPLVDATIDDAAAEMSGVPDNDCFGDTVANLGDTDGDGLDDLLIGDRDMRGVAWDAGAAYVVLGPAGTIDADLADASILGADAYAHVGAGVAGGDVDGDGYADAVVSAKGTATTLLFHGPVLGALDPSDAAATLVGSNEAGDYLQAGDLTADGRAELVIGNHLGSGLYIEEGAVYVVPGAPSGVWPLADAASAVYRGAAERDYFGWGVAVGDEDRDGFGDLWLGAPWNDLGASGGGRVYLLPGG
jgi:hypothetical protein